jgi:UDP-2-acetamido-2,6-beta-L-arabino-hexul-4-ose reductase
MKALVTGADGFLGKNLISALTRVEGVQVTRLGSGDSLSALKARAEEAEIIFHFAGVNRPENRAEFTEVNIDFTKQLIDQLRHLGKRTPIIFSSSSQADNDSDYGKSKALAEKLLENWRDESSSQVAVYRLPGIFGKWSRPNYNTVVATFCHNLILDLPLRIKNPDESLTLIYIDDFVKEMLRFLNAEFREGDFFRSISPTFQVTVGQLADRLTAIHNIRASLEIPDMGDALNRNLLATYSSFLPRDELAYPLPQSQDDRGRLAEFIKAPSFGQVFVSTTKPGEARGNHWHDTKVEKFLVIFGSAHIQLRSKVNSAEVLTYSVQGHELRVVDIPVGYVHSITNTGSTELVTLFWASEVFDTQQPDTFFEQVLE